MTTDGQTCFFLIDNWRLMSSTTSAPELFSFAKNKLISVQAVLSMEVFYDPFHLPVSQVALVQMQTIEDELAQVALSIDKDKCTGSRRRTIGRNSLF